MTNNNSTIVGHPVFALSIAKPEPEPKHPLIIKEKVLLVDDSRVVRKLFSLHLSDKYDCVEAGSFDEALAELRKTNFSIVITDIIMPGLSGIELLRKVIEDFPETAVIVASGVDRPQRALDAIRLGAFDYLIKPCDPEVLQITVERALERRELLKNARRHKLELETWNAELESGKAKLERLQAHIVQSAKMASLGQLAAGVAHELNNPVGFVFANLEMLDQFVHDLMELVKIYERSVPESNALPEIAAVKKNINYPEILSEIESIIRDCREGSNRIRDISQNLRTFSRLDEAEFKTTNINEGIDATIRVASQYFSSDRIALVRNYGNLPTIGAFSGQLNQVWMNLIVNAAQSIGDEKGQVKISTASDDQYVFVEISDTGCGIPVQNLDRIFDPFFTTKPVGEGTGLGLSISYSIVERHGGSITASSKLNEGTTFKVQLPVDFAPSEDLQEKSIARFFAN